MKDNVNLCPAPWVISHIDASGSYRHCCIARSNIRSRDGSYEKPKNYLDQYNSEYTKNARKLMLSGVLPAECSNCQLSNRTQTYKDELRIKYNEIIDEIISSTTQEGFAEKCLIRELDYRSNTCNLYCLTCGPHSSSKWRSVLSQEKELLSRAGVGSELRLTQEMLSNKLYESEFERVVNECKDITSLYFAGGEPLLSPLHDKILSALVESNRSQNISLFYNTNLNLNQSVMQKWLNQLCHFKNVSIGASLDGHPQLSNFIRAASHTDIFLTNYNLIRNSSLPNVNLFLDTTITSLLYLEIEKFILFLIENNLPVVSKLMIASVQLGGFLRVEALPQKIRKEQYAIFMSLFNTLSVEQKLRIENLSQHLKIGLELDDFPREKKVNFRYLIEFYEKKMSCEGYIDQIDKSEHLYL